MNRISWPRAFAVQLLLALGVGIAVPTWSAAVSASDEPITALPPAPALDAAKVALGSKMFADRRLSRDNSLSCASCHDLAKGGADSRPGSRVYSSAVGGVKTIFNTPTVYNAALNYRQQWAGGAATLEAQVDKGVKNPLVFDSNWKQVLAKLGADRALLAEFERTYPRRGLTQETVQDSIALFERSLLTPSRFDRYLRGDTRAISDDERRGYERFKAYGCASCHQGVNVGGNMQQRFGAMKDYFADRVKAGLPAGDGDAGRFIVTHDEADRHVFKVPGLRNVALTAPYFHNGSAATLEEAVDVMFRYQLGRAAPPEDKALIVKFLGSLTGERFHAP